MLINKNQTFDPNLYSISIRKEIIDNKYYFVGRVAELPDLVSYEATYEDAHDIILDAIHTSKEIYDDRNMPFPLPFQRATSEFNGRITLRLPRTLHAQVSYLANLEEVSINQYLSSAISFFVGSKQKGLIIEENSREYYVSNLNLFDNIYKNINKNWSMTVQDDEKERSNCNKFDVNKVQVSSKHIKGTLLLAA